MCCRLLRGLGFHTNCLAEDAFVHMILADCFSLGWRRIEKYTEGLPETDRDRDFDRVARVATNEDIAFLMRGGRSLSHPFNMNSLQYDFPSIPRPVSSCVNNNIGLIIS